MVSLTLKKYLLLIYVIKSLRVIVVVSVVVVVVVIAKVGNSGDGIVAIRYLYDAG